MKHHSKAFLFVTVIALMLAACQSGNKPAAEGQPSDGQPAASQQPSASQQSEPEEEIDYFKFKEPVEISIAKDVAPDLKLPEGETIEDNQYSRDVFNQTNIRFKIAWYASGQDFQQKQKLAIASNDIPDVMLVDESTFRQLAAAGQLEDMTEIYDKYAHPGLKKMYDATEGLALQKATYGGKLLAIPNLSALADSVSLLWVRQDWLDKLKLPAPATMHDVTAIAKAFVEQDPDGDNKANTIGLTGNGTSLYSATYSAQHDFTGIFAAYDSYPGMWIKDEAGKIIYSSTTAQTKNALAKIRELYQNGLIDKEFALRKDPNQLVNSGKAGMFFAPWWAPWPLGDAVKNDPAADWKPYWIADSEGKYNTHKVAISSHFIVTRKGFEHPEAVMTYINWYTRDYAIEKPAKKADVQEVKLDPNLMIALLPLYTTYVHTDAVERVNDVLKKLIAGELDINSVTQGEKVTFEMWQRDSANPKANIADWSPPYAYLVGGDAIKRKADRSVFNEYTATTKTMERRWANLQKLETETFYKIVMGDETIDAFDKFVEEWKKQGGEEITAEVQAEIDNQK